MNVSPGPAARVACLVAVVACSGQRAGFVGTADAGDPDAGAPRDAGGGPGASFDDASGGDATGPGAGPTCTPTALAPPADCTSLGVRIEPPFDATYTCVDLGTLGAIPSPWGGFAVSPTEASSIVVTGNARGPSGRLYKVSLGRDAACHITGFVGAPIDVGEAPYNEAGVAYGPNGVLFLAQAVVNKLGQMKPGSAVTDKVVDMTPHGVDTSMCGVGFVPSSFGAAGDMKLIDWPAPGYWYSARLAPDANGTYDVSSVTRGPSLPGGAAGFVFIAAGNPGFASNTVLVSNYDSGNVVAYELDAESNPKPETSRPFLTGLTGAQGGVVDPTSGDFLFSTFQSARIVVIRGFRPPPPPPPPPR